MPLYHGGKCDTIPPKNPLSRGAGPAETAKEDPAMAVYTEKKTYHTKANMGMIDVT